jgi:hypothetical protein
MSQFLYDKKIILTFDSYAKLSSHLDGHYRYYDWQVEMSDTHNIVPSENVISLTWWYDQNEILHDNDYPPWSPEFEGKAIRVEILISSLFKDSFLAKVNEVSAEFGHAPDDVEVLDYTE